VDKSHFVVVAQIGAPYGIEGWHHIRSFTTPLEGVLQYKEWYVAEGSQWQPHTLLEGRRHGQGVVARLEGIESRESAAVFTQRKIGILREDLASLPPDQFYWADLEDLPVQTMTGKALGKVVYLYHNAGADIMVIKEGAEERHVPFLLNDTVLKVDLEKKHITVDWPF